MPRQITFPRIQDARGNLSVAEKLPFEIRRAYWIYDLSADATRGGHSHRTLERILIAMSGSFVAVVNDEPFKLYKPWIGLYVAPMEWLDLCDFSGGAVCLALASAEYDKADYIRDKSEWMTIRDRS